MSRSDGWDPPRPGWTCTECGFEFDATPPATAAEAVEALIPHYRLRLLSPRDSLRRRPDKDTWSALEYSCHVRDCLALYEERIRRVLAEYRPELPPMRRDALVVERRYNEQDPTAVTHVLAHNGARLAAVLRRVDDSAWDRTGVRDGEVLTVAWMAVNVVHELRHHVMDMDRSFSSYDRDQ